MATIPSPMSLRRRKRGAALVEFAVVSIVFFTFIFGVTEFGRMIYDYNLIATATRDGARWACVRGNSSGHEATVAEIRSYVVGRALNRIALEDVTVTWPDAPTGVAKPGNRVVITTTKNFASMASTLLPFA